MANVSFNGVTKIIQVTAPPVDGYLDITVLEDLYSEWKNWFLESTNSKYLQAMYAIGGEPLPGNLKVGSTFFIINDWKIRPYESTHTLRVDGNLYCEDGSSPYVPTVGTYNVQIISSVSSLPTTIETGVSGLTSAESAQLGVIDEVNTKVDDTLTTKKFLALK